MSTASVSVVIPTRDRPQSLERAVYSALAQTTPPLEVIVVDDGERRAALPPHPRVRVVRRTNGRGDAGAARNQGVAEAQGELIAFLDDDDIWHPDKLALQLAVLGTAAATFCGFEVRDERGSLLERHLPVAHDLRHELLKRPVGQTSGLLVRREAFYRAGGFPEGTERTEDWVLFLRIVEHGVLVLHPEVLVSRAPSTTSPEAQLASLVHLYEAEIEPRLTAANRKSVDAHHRLIRGVLLAQMGDRRAAVHLLRRSSAPWQVLRVAIGERAWNRLRRVVYGPSWRSPGA